MQCGADRGCAVQSRRADAPRCCCCLLYLLLPTGPRLETLLARAWHCRPELDNTGPSLRTADPSLTLLARSCHYWPEVDICDPPELHITTVQSRHDSTACTTLCTGLSLLTEGPSLALLAQACHYTIGPILAAELDTTMPS